MANVEHNVLAGADLHEPKALAAASEDQVLTRKGATATWIDPKDLVGIVKAPLFIQTADLTVANSVTEVTILGAGLGTLIIPANSLKVGSVIICKVEGIVSDTMNPTLRVRIKAAGVTIVDSGAVSLGGTSDDHFAIDVQMIVRTIGTTGTMMTTGGVITSRNDHFGLVRAGASPDVSVINTTLGLAMDATVEWGTAATGNTITSQICVLKVD